MVEAVESAYISPETGGQIKTIHVKEGDKVKKGDLLISLNTSVLKNSIDEVKKGLELATKVYEKQKTLWESNVGSEIQFLQAENNKESLEQRLETLNAQLDLFIIQAPFSGIVDRIISKEGELGAPGMPILQLVNLNALKVKADVSEHYLPAVKKGETVEVCFPTYPDLCVEETIFRTGNVIQVDNRTFTIELRMNNIENKLKPNMMAVIEINDYTRENSIIVPSSIIKNDIKGKFLFVAKEVDGVQIAQKTMVETGRSYDGNTVVLKGLKQGDNVIVKGFNTVATGTEITLK
jgi:membrane fusion protein, multidrug efflux system